LRKRCVESTELRPDCLVSLAQTRKAELMKVLQETTKASERAPSGRLRFDRKGNTVQYYHRLEHSDNKGIYLKRKQDSLAVALAQKAYDSKLTDELKVQIDALANFLDEYRPEKIDEIFDAYHECRKKLIRPVKLSDQDYINRWMSVEYVKKSFDENSAEYYTAKGERVRSKSEILIADALNRFNIPYRYEFPTTIPGLGVCYPDFTCLNVRSRKEYIWEHFGMMADPKYSENAIDKIEKYIITGLCNESGLIMTFETKNHPINARLIEHHIRQYLLRDESD